MHQMGPIGIFDSGYGGLTVMKEIVEKLPQYDYLYMGDNARAPYGNRSFETVYQYSLQCVKWFFEKGCPLVIFACNTASAKALRTIQQKDLPKLGSEKRVLGVIRPTAEVIGKYSDSGEIGVLATSGTVSSESYVLETSKFFPELKVYQQACPMLVPLIENNEYQSPGATYFIRKYVQDLLQQSGRIDTVLLACTHYPVIFDQIKACLPPTVRLLSQGPVVAASLADYLERHPEMEERIGKGRRRSFFTTDDTKDFEKHASLFFGEAIQAEEAKVLP